MSGAPSHVRREVRPWASKLTTLRRLSWPNRWLLLESWLLVTAVSLLLRVFTFRRVYGRLRRLSAGAGAPPGSEAQAARAAEVARVVAMACRHTPLANSCLHRSLALWWLLRRRHIDAELRMGARQEKGAFEAHAWVEYRNTIVGETEPDHRYVPLTWTQVERDS